MLLGRRDSDPPPPTPPPSIGGTTESTGGASGESQYAQCVARLSTSDLRQQFAAFAMLRQLSNVFLQVASQQRNTEAQLVLDAKVMEALSFALSSFVDALGKGSAFSENLAFNVLDALCNYLFYPTKLKHRFTTLPTAIASLVSLMKHPNYKIKAFCARAIWNLCTDFPPAKDKVSNCGALNHLVDTLFQTSAPGAIVITDPSSGNLNDYVAEQVCGAIWALSWDHKQNQSRFRHLKAIQALVYILNNALAGDRLLCSAASALCAIIWLDTDNQNYCANLSNHQFFDALRRLLTFKKQDLNSNFQSEESFILAQGAELASAFCSGNPNSRKLFKNENLSNDLIQLLSSPHVGIRVQACGAIYSASINDLEMQIELGVKHKGILRILEMMSNALYRSSMVDKLTGMVALGSLLRKCPQAQEQFLEIHRAKPPVNDLSSSIPKLFVYLEKNFEQEMTKLPSVLEAIYNVNVDHYAGRFLLGTAKTNVVPFLLKVLFSNTIPSPIKLLAADALRVTVHRAAGAQNQVSSDDIRKLYELLKGSTDELQFAISGVIASLSLQTDANAVPENIPAIRSLMQIPDAAELFVKVAQENCRATGV
jgi:hypothetical protein